MTVTFLPAVVNYWIEDSTAGTPYDSETVTAPATTVGTLPSAPSKDGYTFGGWYTAVNGGGTSFTATTAVTVSINVFAQWTETGTDGLAYTLNADGISYSVAIGTASSASIVIPATYNGLPVTAIAANGFQGCTMTSLTIPSSVTSVGDMAFVMCMNLTTVTINAVTPPSAGMMMFMGCPLASLIVPTSSINAYSTASGWADYADFIFLPPTAGLAYTLTGGTSYSVAKGTADTSGTVAIPSTWEGLPVTAITASGFSGCTGMTKIVMPSCITTIGDSAFSGCTGMIKAALPSSLVSIGDSAFYNCTGVTGLTLPSNLVSIGSNSFSGCTSITDVSMPSSVTSIGGYAFSGCTGITTLSIPAGITAIGAFTFSGCTGITTISMPASLATIGDSAFSGCTGLTDLSLMEGLVSIAANAFNGCSALTGATIPSSVTSIGDYAFKGCSLLKGVYVPSLTPPTLGTDAFSGCPLSAIVTFNKAAYTAAAGWNNLAAALYFNNMAKISTITSSYTYAGRSTGSLVDGDTTETSPWCINGNVYSTGSFTVDMGSATTINLITLYPDTYDATPNSVSFKLEGSTDNINWTTIDGAASSMARAANSSYHYISATMNSSYRYIRFTSISWHGWVGVKEIQVCSY